MVFPVRLARILPSASPRIAAVVSLGFLALSAGAAPAGAAEPTPAGATGASGAAAPAPASPASTAAHQPFLPRRTPALAPGSAQPGLHTPRAAVRSYLIAARAARYEDAALYLDLSDVPEELRAERGPRLAREMKIVLDQRLWIDLESLSDGPEGADNDGLDPDRDRVGVIEGAQGLFEINVLRTEGSDGQPEWRFSPGTVHRIETLYAEIGYGPLLKWIPDWGTRMRFGNLMGWQWIALLVLATIAALLSKLLTRAVLQIVLFLSRRTDPDFRNRIMASVLPPLRLATVVAIVVIGALWLRLSVPAKRMLGHVLIGLILLLVTWMMIRLIDFATSRTLDKLEAQGRRSGITTLVLIRRIAKAVVVVIAVLAGLQNLGFNVSGLLAGFGIAGAAVALAAQKTLENLFGGLVLTADEPMRIGDLCQVKDRQGTVEDIGLRSTRIRTAERTIVSVPNAEMSTVPIENLSLRDRFRLQSVLHLRYETTVDQLNTTLKSIRKLLTDDSRVSPIDRRVSFIAFGDDSLRIEVVAYVLTTEVLAFYEIQEELLLEIMRIVAESGPGLALPSRTLYLPGGESPGAPTPAKHVSGT